jgi:hypothetical protein
MTHPRSRLIAAILAVLALSACGVEGPPRAPEAPPGLSVGGEVRIGISGEL